MQVDLFLYPWPKTANSTSAPGNTKRKALLYDFNFPDLFTSWNLPVLVPSADGIYRQGPPVH